ncbi:MAG TPA: isoprenylcysteine carboxyl methyltransferase family protein [Jiangellaceae bacterium]|nr:isoprenylcysteine carboxyl methyltransferase family protein [Jiangellaceae bacterium]
MIAYIVLVAAVAGERVAELVVSKRHAAWAFARGGVEYGTSHYPAMVVVHAALLVSCVVEVAVADRPFVPWLGWPMLAVVAATEALRWWCVTSLGKQWNTRVIVVPDLPLVRRGPYRWLRHPNYLVVTVEVAALPLVHTAWVTAVVFSVANAVLLLGFRIPVEERALATVGSPDRRLAT